MICYYFVVLRCNLFSPFFNEILWKFKIFTQRDNFIRFCFIIVPFHYRFFFFYLFTYFLSNMFCCIFEVLTYMGMKIYDNEFSRNYSIIVLRTKVSMIWSNNTYLMGLFAKGRGTGVLLLEAVVFVEILKWWGGRGSFSLVSIFNWMIRISGYSGIVEWILCLGILWLLFVLSLVGMGSLVEILIGLWSVTSEVIWIYNSILSHYLMIADGTWIKLARL